MKNTKLSYSHSCTRDEEHLENDDKEEDEQRDVVVE